MFEKYFICMINVYSAVFYSSKWCIKYIAITVKGIVIQTQMLNLVLEFSYLESWVKVSVVSVNKNGWQTNLSII